MLRLLLYGVAIALCVGYVATLLYYYLNVSSPGEQTQYAKQWLWTGGLIYNIVVATGALVYGHKHDPTRLLVYFAAFSVLSIGIELFSSYLYLGTPKIVFVGPLIALVEASIDPMKALAI